MHHTASQPGRPGAYDLTAAGQALSPIVWAMGQWAAEWVFGDPSEADCDGLSLIWRTHQFAIAAKLPETRTVVHLVLAFRDLIADGSARFLGPSRLAKAFPTWFDTTVYSHGLRRGQQRRRHETVPA